MTVSTETVRMAKSRARKNQSERSDLPCHIIISHILVYVILLLSLIRKITTNLKGPSYCGSDANDKQEQNYPYGPYGKYVDGG